MIVTKEAYKDLRLVPFFIVDKFDTWIQSVHEIGIVEVRKIPGYHDEPLLGKRKGFRSIRLSRSYRAIYKTSDEFVELIVVCEVNKHVY